MRAGWNAWRPAVWQMEHCHRWRGASTAAAASGGKAQDKDTLTVRAAQCVPVISHCDAASLEYKICNIAFQLHDTAAALQYFLLSAEYTAASNKMCSYSVIIIIEIPHKSIILFFQLRDSLDAVRFVCFTQTFCGRQQFKTAARAF